MKHSLIDTNVIIRYLVEDPETIRPKFRGVYVFFEKVEKGQLQVQLPELVLFEAFFVLTSFYEVPAAKAAQTLDLIVALKGVLMQDKGLIRSCLMLLQNKKIDLVDAYILAVSRQKKIKTVYSFDNDLKKNGLEQLKVQ
jgi:predicted nucleic acid-binding protein